MAATNDYLDDAAQRLVAMWKEVLNDFDSDYGWHVQDYIEPGLPTPYVWLYPGLPQLTQLSMESDAQVYAVTVRLDMGSATSRFDGALMRDLWRLLPKVTNYFLSRKQLIYQADQEKPRYLSGKGAYFGQIQPFGQFNGSDDVGIELQHVLPFLVSQEQFEA